MPAYKFTRKEPTTVNEVERTILLTKSPWLKAIIVFLFLYGCRITEALHLERRKVRVEDGYIIAEIGVLKRREKQKGPYGILPHLVHVSVNSPLAKEHLIPYLSTVTNPDAKLFPVSRQLVWLRLKEANSKISPHVFRHDRLMKLALRGATESELVDWAGWTDSRSASNYIRATGRLAKNLADKVE